MLSKSHKGQIIPRIIPFPWYTFLPSPLPLDPLPIQTPWMTDHAHTSYAISWVFTAQILSELKLIWHILQTDLVFIQQTIAQEGHPQKTRTLILMGVKRANIFILLWCVLDVCRASVGTQAILLPSQVNTFVFVGPDQWNSLKEIEKSKLKLDVTPTITPPKSTRKFHSLQKTEDIGTREGLMLLLVLYHSVESRYPLPSILSSIYMLGS